MLPHELEERQSGIMLLDAMAGRGPLHDQHHVEHIGGQLFEDPLDFAD